MLAAMGTGDVRDASDYVHDAYRNAESADHPGREALRGPAEFAATTRWLRGAFSELAFEERALVAEGDTIAVEAVMSGVHTGRFMHLAPTGRAFRQRQTHWFTIRDGKIASHRAYRDDLGLMRQLGGVGAARPD